MRNSVAVIGSGPAGLMVASVLARAGVSVTVFERRAGLGRKLLVAGSSGLNVSSALPADEFLKNYTGPAEVWKQVLSRFTVADWLKFIENLGLETFLGTSGRYFVRGMKGSSLLRAWTDSLKEAGVRFVLNSEVTEFSLVPNLTADSSQGPRRDSVALKIRNSENPQSSEIQAAQVFSAVCFCLGGGSWEKTPPAWPALFVSKGLSYKPFEAANCGFKVDWTEAFLKEAEGLPLKSIVFHSPLGSRAGEVMITSYGLEGTPVYSLGKTGVVHLDLKPSLSSAEILKKLQAPKEKLNPMRRVKKYLNLSPAALALIYHGSSPHELADLKLLVDRIKRFPIVLKERQPLEEAISSSGGLGWEDLNSSLMLKRFPGVFVAGEMIDWSAPTGGFLIQGCVSMGAFAGSEISKFL